jgi:hypothetical protein
VWLTSFVPISAAPGSNASTSAAQSFAPSTCTKPVEGTGWPPPQSFTVRECLLVVLNEEWEHRL